MIFKDNRIQIGYFSNKNTESANISELLHFLYSNDEDQTYSFSEAPKRQKKSLNIFIKQFQQKKIFVKDVIVKGVEYTLLYDKDDFDYIMRFLKEITNEDLENNFDNKIYHELLNNSPEKIVYWNLKYDWFIIHNEYKESFVMLLKNIIKERKKRQRKIFITKLYYYIDELFEKKLNSAILLLLMILFSGFFYLILKLIYNLFT